MSDPFYQTVIANIVFSGIAYTEPGQGKTGGGSRSEMSPDLHCPEAMAACIYISIGMSVTHFVAYYRGIVV